MKHVRCRNIAGLGLSFLALILIAALPAIAADSDEIGDEDEIGASSSVSAPPPPSGGRRNAQFSAQCKSQVLVIAVRQNMMMN
jgi:hypothetical protein